MPVTNTALSGLRAANNKIEVLSNNIANSNTTGFKSSSINFADVYAQNGAVGAQIGRGVQVSSIMQDFTSGSASLTGKTLDLSIANEGFFVTQNSQGEQSYTRAGNFLTDKTGRIVNDQNNQVMGYNYNTATPQVLIPTLAPLAISSATSPPAATANVNTAINLDSRITRTVFPAFDPTNSTTYDARSDTTVYDSLGNSHTLSFFYVKQAAANNWVLNARVDDTIIPGGVDPVGPMTFSAAGALTAPVGGTFALSTALTNGATTPFLVTANFTGSTQYGSDTRITSSTQDGYTTGNLSGISVDGSGNISARYTNGQVTNLAQVAVAKFTNPQGLLSIGNQSWSATNQSGVADVQPFNSIDAIQSGFLEDSNVDLPKNLVDLISTQRFFQANTQSVQVANSMIETILQIR